MTTLEKIKIELDDCYKMAVREGYEGTRDEWEPTAEDLESVCDALGRQPSRGEWEDAGIVGVGSAHVGSFEQWNTSHLWERLDEIRAKLGRVWRSGWEGVVDMEASLIIQELESRDTDTAREALRDHGIGLDDQ